MQKYVFYSGSLRCYKGQILTKFDNKIIHHKDSQRCVTKHYISPLHITIIRSGIRTINWRNTSINRGNAPSFLHISFPPQPLGDSTESTPPLISAMGCGEQRKFPSESWFWGFLPVHNQLWQFSLQWKKTIMLANTFHYSRTCVFTSQICLWTLHVSFSVFFLFNSLLLSFCTTGLHTWNDLPDTIQDFSPTFSTFTKLLKSYLFILLSWCLWLFTGASETY